MEGLTKRRECIAAWLNERGARLCLSFEETGASMIKPGKTPEATLWSSDHGETVVTVPFLSELEIAMLELLEAGIDHWSARSSRSVADRLVARGLVALDQTPSLIDPQAARYRITASGLQSLAAARSLPERPTHWRQIM
jgi:hypothetical protein